MKKLIAGLMTALIALLTATTPVLAATQLGSYPTFLKGADGTLQAYVVVGSAANVADVIGAVDLASRLEEVGKTAVSTTCAGATGAVTGTEKDAVPLYGALSVTFPASGILKSAHYSGLKDSTFSWRGTDYDYREQVDFGSVTMRHSLILSNVNGTEKMVVNSGDIKYQYVFDKTLTGTGSTGSPNYTYPVNIKLLGKAFAIVGVDTSQVKMLQGSIGTATATTPVVYSNYSVYSDLGYNAGWARVIIKDSNGNTVDTMTITQSDNKESSATGLTVMITAVRALQDGTVVGSDLVVGLTSEGVTKTYDNTADVTSTGTSSDRFPGQTEWGIQVGTNAITSATAFATQGQISNGDLLEVVYKPSTTQYLIAGQKISLPESYGELGYEGWNTDKFATITIAPLSSTVSAYNYSSDTQAFGSLSGIEIASDVAGSIASTANTGYTKAYVLFNYSRTSDFVVPVFIGFKDEAKGKIMVNGTILDQNTANTGSEFVSKLINYTNITDEPKDKVSYAFRLIYGNAGDQTFYLNFTVGGSAAQLINASFAGKATGTANFTFEYQNKTSVLTTQAPEFRLGETASTTEVAEINVTTEGASNQNAGKKTQEVTEDSGLLLQNSESYGASDKVVFKVPFKDLKEKIYFGKLGSTTSGETVTYTSYPSIPITSTIAKLDTEITATEKAKNLVSVGGSCVNTVTAAALGLTYPACGASSTIPENRGLIKVVDSPYTEGTGKVVLVVAGWEAANTRTACSVLQLYDTKLTGVTASAVTVTGTVGAPTVTPA